MSSFFLSFALAFSCATVATAQDPAGGWMAYAVGDISSTGANRITRLDMKWVVSDAPSDKLNAFYSPWFGMDPADNLNLIQPVNPWLGDSWAVSVPVLWYCGFFLYVVLHQYSILGIFNFHARIVFKIEGVRSNLTYNV